MICAILKSDELDVGRTRPSKMPIIEDRDNWIRVLYRAYYFINLAS
jgi:hypothetical protein